MAEIKASPAAGSEKNSISKGLSAMRLFGWFNILPGEIRWICYKARGNCLSGFNGSICYFGQHLKSQLLENDLTRTIGFKLVLYRIDKIEFWSYNS